jgi:hypothetical protein
MATGGKAYLGLGQPISLILAIIPFTNWPLGIIQCILRKKWLGAILRFFGMGFFILWICDIYTMYKKKDITVLA